MNQCVCQVCAKGAVCVGAVVATRRVGVIAVLLAASGVSVRYCGYRGGAPAQDSLSDHSTIKGRRDARGLGGRVCVAAGAHNQ